MRRIPWLRGFEWPTFRTSINLRQICDDKVESLLQSLLGVYMRAVTVMKLTGTHLPKFCYIGSQSIWRSNSTSQRAPCVRRNTLQQLVVWAIDPGSTLLGSQEEVACGVFFAHHIDLPGNASHHADGQA